jgi:hypothetical protein
MPRSTLLSKHHSTVIYYLFATFCVSDPPVMEPFFFPSSLQEGSRAQVSCSISSGDLPIEFTWLKDGQPLPPSLQVTNYGRSHTVSK